MKTKTTNLSGPHVPAGYVAPRTEPQANKDLKALMAQMKQLADACNAWIAAHPRGCRCPFCRMDRHGEHRQYIRDDLGGVAWACLNVAASIDGEVLCGYGKDKA